MGKFKMNGGGKQKPSQVITNIQKSESLDISAIVAQVKAAMPEPTVVHNITQVIKSDDTAQVVLAPSKDKKARLHSKLVSNRLKDVISALEDNSKITSNNFREMAILIQQDRAVIQQINDSLKSEQSVINEKLKEAQEKLEVISNKKPEEIQVVTNNTIVQEVNNKLVYILLAASLVLNIVVLLKN